MVVHLAGLTAFNCLIYADLIIVDRQCSSTNSLNVLNNIGVNGSSGCLFIPNPPPPLGFSPFEEINVISTTDTVHAAALVGV